jgi:endonuclease G
MLAHMEIGEDGVAPPTIDDDPEQTAAAKERVLARTARRDEKKRTLSEPQGIARADDPARVAKRMDRLARYHCGDDLPTGPSDLSDEDVDTLFSHAALRVARSKEVPAVGQEATDPDKIFERVVNNSDFLERSPARRAPRSSTTNGRSSRCTTRACARP